MSDRHAHAIPRDAGDAGSGEGSLPHWDLTPIYPDIDSPEFTDDLAGLEQAIVTAREAIADGGRRRNDPTEWLRSALDALGQAADLHETLDSYCYSRFSVETGNEQAIAALNRVAEIAVPLASLAVEFRNALAEIGDRLDGILAQAEDLAGFRHVLADELFLQKRQLSAPEEDLAADLARSGADAWSRLHETLSSTLTAVWDDETGETKTVVELRALAYSDDRTVRRRAWEKELAAWKRVEIPIAFALNGVKGASHTLNSRRGWESTLDRSARQNRLSRKALDAMIAVMEESLPMFRRYLGLKARALDLPRLSFYDLFAPVGAAGSRWSFEDAMGFIADRIGAFDPDQGVFVRRALAERWIDAEPRPGKVGGAYCIEFPTAGTNRILANFDGTYDGVSTLAHELGHAWHSEQLRDLPALQRHYPMTLAETASIFSETLVFFATLEESDGNDARYILEQFLQGGTQVIVDILSRFFFERELMDRRARGEVSAQDLQEMMLAAQRRTYGDGLNGEELHPYMWAVKGHYYNLDLAFYNFPYAFGQLFGLGLYAQYRRNPEGFAARYRTLLRETGRQDAVAVTALAGFDIESPAFWRDAMGEIAGLVDRFERLVTG